MSKHTPGPWRLGKSNLGNSIEGYCGKTFFEGDDGFRVVCMYQSCEPTGLYKEEDENAKANARLIAAAPELLDVLLFIQRGLNSGHIKAPPFLDFSNPHAESLDLQHPSALVDAVIKKATGE